MTAITERPIWSKSQMNAFHECRRKYYFSTLSSSLEEDNSPGEPWKQEAKNLKKMKNRFLWAGSIVHQSLADMLKSLRQDHQIQDEEKWIDEIRQKMRDEYQASLGEEDSSSRLFEHHYKVTVSPGDWKQMWSNVEKSLRWFLKSSWMTRLKTLGPESWKAIEEILSFDVDGIKAFFKIDCALEVDGKFILIDWKTSAYRPEDDKSLQIAALYAHDVWEAAPEQIEGYVISLKTGTHHKVSVNEETLMEAQLRIQEESTVLKEADLHAIEDPMDIPMTSNTGTCFRCNFQKLCHPKGIGA